MFPRLIIISFFLFQGIVSYAQEINCNVIVDKLNVATVQDFVIQDLKQAIQRFLNETKWTNDTYLPEERIKCNILISFTSSPDVGQYVATAQIQSSRPIYGTSYETILFNFIDPNFNFDYNTSQPMIYNDNMYTSSLTSMLAFYAYVILALDYDSFSKLGGTPYIDKARNISLTAQGQGDGWDGNNLNSRTALANDLNSQQFVGFREGYYTYHRIAMDNFLQKPKEGRAIILDYLKKTKALYIIRPSSILIKTFFLSKRLEMVSVFSEADTDVKISAVNLLKELDPTYADKYGAIIK